MQGGVRKMITKLIGNARTTGGKAVCTVMMTAAFLGHQPSQGAASDALRSQVPTSAAGPDEDGGNTVESGPHVKLYGTWIANDVDTEMGEVKIKLTFRRVGTLRLLAWSDIPFVGQVKDLKAPYEVHRDTIRSKAIRGGATVQYSFEGEQLLLQFEGGKVVRFRRE